MALRVLLRHVESHGCFDPLAGCVHDPGGQAVLAVDPLGGLGDREVVVAREKAGRSQSWEKIPGIWELTADPEQLAGRVKAVIDRFLGKKI